MNGGRLSVKIKRLELMYLYFPPSLHQIIVVSVRRPFVVITTLSTGLVITTKGLQDRNNNYLMERRWKIKVN